MAFLPFFDWLKGKSKGEQEWLGPSPPLTPMVHPLLTPCKATAVSTQISPRCHFNKTLILSPFPQIFPSTSPYHKRKNWRRHLSFFWQKWAPPSFPFHTLTHTLPPFPKIKKSRALHSSNRELHLPFSPPLSLLYLTKPFIFLDKSILLPILYLLGVLISCNEDRRMLQPTVEIEGPKPTKLNGVLNWPN